MKTKEDLEKEIEEAEEAERLAALEEENDLDVNSDDDGETDDDTGDGDDSGADEDGEGDEKPVPSFMTDEDEDEADDDGAAKEQEGTIRAIAKQREKKRLAEEKAEKLEQENELLRKQLATGASTKELGPRPKIEDHDTDEAFYLADDAWHAQKATAGAPAAQAASDQAQEAQRHQKRVTDSYDAHLGRADVLVKEHNIDVAVYRQAEDSFIDAVIDAGNLPKGFDTNQSAELYMKNMIEVVGEGSEKVIFNLLANKKSKKEFEAILATDKNGLKVAAWLGAKAYALREAETKKRSNARKPAPQTNSNASGGKSSKALKKKFDAKVAAGDDNEAMNLRRQAKKAGVDVSDWV